MITIIISKTIVIILSLMILIIMIVDIITLLLTARSSTPPNLGANNWKVLSARPQDRTTGSTDDLTLIS